MKTAIIQAPLVWENPQANLDYFSEKIKAINEKVDLIVLPEMFATGFTMNPEQFAQKMQGDAVLWMQLMAQTKDSAVTGSLVIEENGVFYNRLLFIYPSGTIQTYNKRHLFSLAGEDKAFTPGKEKLIIDYNGWKICPLICYDLRFPVFSRNTENYDLSIYVANWPKARITAWDVLLKARAIENMSYVIGVNRIGEDKDGLEYNGHSQIIDPMGNHVTEPNEMEGVVISHLELENVKEMREKFSFLDDRDHFTISD